DTIFPPGSGVNSARSTSFSTTILFLFLYLENSIFITVINKFREVIPFLPLRLFITFHKYYFPWIHIRQDKFLVRSVLARGGYNSFLTIHIVHLDRANIGHDPDLHSFGPVKGRIGNGQGKCPSPYFPMP